MMEDYSQEEFTEFRLVREYYGDKVAERSQVPLINHISEGLYILWSINASESAMRAFCLHPLVQNDADFSNNIKIFDNDNVDKRALALALEYRNIANQYLSHRAISSIKEINLSPLKEVNDMLIADKIQNYKDFILYHQRTHPRRVELTQYFENWLWRLEVYDFDNWFRSMKYQFPVNGKEDIEYEGLLFSTAPDIRQHVAKLKSLCDDIDANAEEYCSHKDDLLLEAGSVIRTFLLNENNNRENS